MLRKSGEGLPVTTAPVEKSLLGESVFSSGTVYLKDGQRIYASGTKIVSEIRVKQGEKVVQGQVLGYLESLEETARLKQAEADLAIEKANMKKALEAMPKDLEASRSRFNQAGTARDNKQAHLQRIQKLYDSGVASAEELEEAGEGFALAEADYIKAQTELQKLQGASGSAERESLQAGVDRAKAQLELAGNEVEKLILRAQRDGIVMAVKVNEGDYVNTGDELMVIGDPDRLEIQSELGEGDANKAKLGQEVEVSATSLPGVLFTGRVTEIALAAEKTSQGEAVQVEVPVKIEIQDTRGQLRPGYTVDLRIVTSPERDTLVVPFEAVMDTGDGCQVYVVDGDKAVLRDIETGLESDLYVEVLRGLSEGEKVILSPDTNLTEGMKVKEVPPNPGGGEVGLT